MTFLLRIALLLPPNIRRILKLKFPRFATLVLTKSSSLTRWRLKQELLHSKYDEFAEGIKIPDVIGPLESTKEIVIVTPTPPIKSGISNYTSKLVKELTELARVRVICSFLEAGENVYSPGIRATFAEGTEGLATRKIVYMLGNGEHHWRTWDLLLKFPGYVIIHDARIPDIPLMNGEDNSWYNYSYQEKASKFLGRIPIHTLGIYCHSENAAELVKSQLREFQLKKIPVKVLNTGHPVDSRRVIPRRLKHSPLIGTFGFQTQNKNLALTYTAISRIALEINGRGLICGKIDTQTKKLARDIWQKNGNSPDDLEIFDWVDYVTYQKLMSQVDFAIQLRSSSNGESSGPLSELTSQGIPTMVTNIGSFAEIPEVLEGIIKIPDKIPEMDLNFFLKPAIDLLKDEFKYSEVSSNLINFYKNKTYKDLAHEIVTEIFN